MKNVNKSHKHQSSPNEWSEVKILFIYLHFKQYLPLITLDQSYLMQNQKYKKKKKKNKYINKWIWAVLCVNWA